MGCPHETAPASRICGCPISLLRNGEANQWKLICTANLADLLDFFDLFLIGYVTAALTKQWSLTYLQGGMILLASGIGAPPGAFFWGWLGDRIGRRTVFMPSA